jgi:hypothetical protein
MFGASLGLKTRVRERGKEGDVFVEGSEANKAVYTQG